MSNHFSDSNLIPDAYLKTIQAKLADSREQHALGATGRFPDGKLGDYDEGEIAFAIAADPNAKKVLIDFGKPVAFLGMTKAQAIELGQLLIRRAGEIED